MVNVNVIKDAVELVALVRGLKGEGKRVGVVPTMGALHAGHLSLVGKAREEADVSLATIFVNPTQFAEGEDLAQYPRTEQADIEQLERAGADIVFIPPADQIYPKDFSTFISPPRVAMSLEGEHRPSHFRGVTTIVLKLLNLTQADVAFFGQKDYQQWLVVKKMVMDLNVPCKIVGCPIVRDADGLALSSRNRYLSEEERSKALSLNRTLQLAEELIREGERDSHVIMNEMKQSLIDGGVDQIDYAMVADAKNLTIAETIRLPAVCLVAAQVGSTRLIDNRVISE